MRPLARLPDDAWAEKLHRPSPVPGLGYELAPGRRARARGMDVETNRFGLRDDEPSDPGTPGVVPVAALGDSFTFGFGVSGDEAWPSALERRLAASGHARVEVLNFGVGGYSLRDEVRVLEARALRWDPALVIFGYVLNDPEVDPIQPLHRYYAPVAWWQRSNLGRLGALLLHVWRIRARGDGDYLRALHWPDGATWRGVEAAFAEISALTRPRDVPVLVAIFPLMERWSWSRYPYGDLHDRVAAAARARGLRVLDLLPAFSRGDPRALIQTFADAHPTARGHAVAAEAIHDWIAAHAGERLR